MSIKAGRIVFSEKTHLSLPIDNLSMMISDFAQLLVTHLLVIMEGDLTDSHIASFL